MVVTPVGATCLMRGLPWVLMLLCRNVFYTAGGVLASVLWQMKAMPAHFVDLQIGTKLPSNSCQSWFTATAFCRERSSLVSILPT